MTPRRLQGRSHAVGAHLVRYAIVGLLSNAVGYLAYLALTTLGLSPQRAMSLLYAIVATVGFFGHRRLTFADDGRLLGTGARYVIAHLGGYLLNLALLSVLVDRLGLAHQAVQAGAILVVAIYLFIVSRQFVFRGIDGRQDTRDPAANLPAQTK
ncbi:MAG: GtrA family protein [Burkholderiaceae bacterium]